MYDLVALGELLIDFTPIGSSETGNPRFEANPGGAPANVLAALVKLGKKGAFIGMVGKDQFGDFLRETLISNGIDATGLKVSSTVNTTLAFVHLDSSGDRSFSFYRNPGADMMLDSATVDFELIKKTKIFHCGSLSLTDEPARSATLAAIRFARENGKIISYDPNYRPPLWNSAGEARKQIQSLLTFTDILKVSEIELDLITGTGDLAKGSAMLSDCGISLILVTLGPQGCFYRYPGGTGKLEAYQVKTVDTTGAGDAFLGGVLYWLSELTLEEIRRLDRGKLEEIVNFGNAMGGLATTKNGAIPAMPEMEQVLELIAKLNR